MNILKIILTVIYAIDCIALTVVVLMQEGKQQYLKDNFAGTAKKLMAKKEALYLLKLAENMYQDECMGLPEITELIERAEVA